MTAPISMSTRSTLGSTELQDADGCTFYFGLNHVSHLQPKIVTRGRKLGSILHRSMQYWYGQFLPVLPDWFRETSRIDAVNIVGSGYPQYIQQGETIFAHYVKQYGEVDKSWRVISVETEYGITVDEIVFWAGNTLTAQAKRALALIDRSTRVTIRPDLMVARQDGVEHTIDYKSTLGRCSRLDKWSRWNSYGLGWQPMYYLWVARHVSDGRKLLFQKLQSFIIQRLLTVEPYTADRNEVEMTVSAYESIPSLIIERLARRKAILDTIARGEPTTPQFGQQCFNRWGACDYFNICRSENADKLNVINAAYEIVH